MSIDYTGLSSVVNGIGLVNILSWLGFSNIREDYNSVRASCAVHGGDRKDSFCIYKNTLVWKCFSKKCEHEYGESFFALIAARLGCSKVDAVDQFCEVFGVDPDTFELDSANERFYKLSSYINYKISTAAQPNVDMVLPNILGFTDYFLSDRGGNFNESTINHFGVNTFYIDKEDRKRVFIPIFDAEGTFVAYSGRAEDDSKSRKYKNSFGPFAGRVLYNLNNARQSKSDYIIVVEGFKSVWRLYEYGYDNVVSCLGSVLKPKQLELLLLTLKRIVLLLDNDDAGIVGTEVALKEYKYIADIIPISYNLDADPADLPKDVIDELLGKYKK